jgi:outer membrane protein
VEFLSLPYNKKKGNTMSFKYTTIAAVLAAVPSVSFAAGDTELGIGAQFRSTAYRNYDDVTRVVPIFKFDTTWFYGDGGELGFKAFDKGPHRIGVFLSMTEEEWVTDDNNHTPFKRFEDKDRGINLGASYRFKASWGVVRAQYFADISDESDGTGATLSYAYPWVINPKLAIVPSVKLKYMDDDYANYYYGISQRDAATTGGLYSPYDTGSATNIEVGISAAYQLADQWKLFAGVNYTALDSDIEDSPLLEDDNETTALIGAAYTF